jgi:hypothetical protein
MPPAAAAATSAPMLEPAYTLPDVREALERAAAEHERDARRSGRAGGEARRLRARHAAEGVANVMRAYGWSA